MTSTSSSDDVKWTPSFMEQFALEWLKHEILLPDHKSPKSKHLTRVARSLERRAMFSVLGLPLYQPWQTKFIVKYKKLLARILTRAWKAQCSRDRQETLCLDEVLPDWMRLFEERFHFADKVLERLRTARLHSNSRLEGVRLLTAVLRAVWGSMRGGGGGGAAWASWVSWDRATHAAAVHCGLATTAVQSMWNNLRKVSMQKLHLLAAAGDREGSGAGGADMRAADWLVVDLLLLYDDTETLLQEYSLKDIEQVSTLMALMPLVQSYGLGQWPLAGETKVWADLTHAYNYRGRSASAVVLQRRWWELVSTTRRALPAARSAPAALPQACRQLALRFPALLTARLPSWRELVERGRVYAHDYALGDTPRWREIGPPPPPLFSSDDAQTAPHHEDDVILVENDAEAIEVDSEADGDKDKREGDTTNKKENSHSEIEKASEKTTKHEICNLRIQKSVLERNKQDMCGYLDEDLDSMLKDIAAQSKVAKPEHPTPRTPSSTDTRPPRKLMKKRGLNSKTTQNLDDNDTNLTQADSSERLISVDLTEGDSSDGESAGVDPNPCSSQTVEKSNANCDSQLNSEAKETQMIIDQDLNDYTNDLNTCSQKQNTNTESFELTENVPDVFSSLSVLEQLDPSGFVAKIIFSDDEDDCDDRNLNLNVDRNADNLRQIQTTDEHHQQTHDSDADITDVDLKDTTHDANIGTKFENSTVNVDPNNFNNDENVICKREIDSDTAFSKSTSPKKTKIRIGPKSVMLKHRKENGSKKRIGPKSFMNCLDSKDNIKNKKTDKVEMKSNDATIDNLQSRESLYFESENTQIFQKDTTRIKTLLTNSDTSDILKVLTTCKIEEASDDDNTNIIIDENVKQQEIKNEDSVVSSSVSATLCFTEELGDNKETDKIQSRTDLNKDKSNKNIESNRSKKEKETNENIKIRPLFSFGQDDTEENDCGNKLKPDIETDREISLPDEGEKPVMKSDSDSELGNMIIDENADKNEVCLNEDSNELTGVPKSRTGAEMNRKASSNKQSNDSDSNLIKSAIMALDSDITINSTPDTAVDVGKKYASVEKNNTIVCVDERSIESDNDSRHVELDGNTSNRDNNEESKSASDNTISVTGMGVEVSSTENNESSVLTENEHSNDQDLTVGLSSKATTKVTGSHSSDDGLDMDQLVMAAQIPIYRVDELACWRRHAKLDRIDLSEVDLSVLTLHPTPRTGKRLKSGLRPSWVPSGKLPRPSFDRIPTVRLARLPLHVVKGYLEKQRSQQNSEDRSLRTRKRVELSDIDEVRRINRRLATAQVRPLSSAQISDCDSGSDSDYVPDGERSTPKRRAVAIADVDNTLTPQELEEILDKLKNPNANEDDEDTQKIKHCCPARRHISYNRARARLASRAGKQATVVDLHSKAGRYHLILECDCCCVGALKEELQASENLARSLMALHEDLIQLQTSRRIKTTPGSKPASATAESKETLSENDQLTIDISNPLKRKKDEQKKKRNKRKKTQENKEEEEEEEQTKQLCNDYAEWVRQRNICNKYFTINPTNSTKKSKNSLTAANPGTPKPCTVTSAELKNQSTFGINNLNSNVQRPELNEKATDPNEQRDPNERPPGVIKANIQTPICKQSKNIELSTQQPNTQLNMGVQRMNTEVPKLTKDMIDLNELAQSCHDDILPVIDIATDDDDAQKTEANAKTAVDLTDELKDSVEDTGLVVTEHNYMKAARVGIPLVKKNNPLMLDHLFRQKFITIRSTLSSSQKPAARKPRLEIQSMKPLIVRLTNKRIPVTVKSSNAVPKVKPSVQFTNQNSCRESKTQPVRKMRSILIRQTDLNQPNIMRRQVSTEANSPKSNETSSVVKPVFVKICPKQNQEQTASKEQSNQIINETDKQNTLAKQRLLHLKDLKISVVQRSNKTTNDNQAASQPVINQPTHNKGSNCTSNQQIDPNSNQTINSAKDAMILNQTLTNQEQNVTMAQQTGQSINQVAPRPAIGSIDQPLLNTSHRVTMIQQPNHGFNQMTSQSVFQPQVNLNPCGNANFTQTPQQMTSQSVFQPQVNLNPCANVIFTQTPQQTSQAGIQYNNLIQCSNMTFVRPPTQMISPLMSHVNQGHNVTVIRHPEQMVQQPNPILNQILPQPVIMPQVNPSNNMIVLGQPEQIIQEPNYVLNQMVPPPVIQNLNRGPNMTVIQNPKQLQPNHIFNQTKSEPTEPNIPVIQQPGQPLSMFHQINADTIVKISGEPGAMQLWDCDINKALLHGLIETSQSSPGLNFMRVLRSQSHESTLVASCITSKENRTHSTVRITTQTPNEAQPTAHIVIKPSIAKYFQLNKETLDQELPKINDANNIRPRSASSAANVVNQQIDSTKKNTNQMQLESEKRNTTNKGVIHVMNVPAEDDSKSNSIQDSLQNTNETDPAPIFIGGDCDQKPEIVDDRSNIEDQVSDDHSMPLISNVVSLSQADYDKVSDNNQSSVRKLKENVSSSSAKEGTSSDTRIRKKDTDYGYHRCKDLFQAEPMYVKDLVGYVRDKFIAPSKLQILSRDSTDPLWMISNRFIVVTDAARDAVTSETFWTIKPRLDFRQILFEEPKVLNSGVSNTPLLKVRAFAKLPGTDNALTTATNEESKAEASEPGFQAEFSDIITTDGKCFQKLSDDPLTYAQVFYAVPSIQSTDQLLNENKSLFLLDTFSDRPLMAFKRTQKQVGFKGISLYCREAPSASAELVHMLNRLREWNSNSNDVPFYVASPPVGRKLQRVLPANECIVVSDDE